LGQGGAVFRSAVIKSGSGAAAELTFADSSKATLSSDSELTIDEFVYSGPGAAANQTVTFAKGSFRFVSGLVPKQNVTLRTPTVTLGIRGTTLIIVVRPDGSGYVYVEEGSVSACQRRQGPTGADLLAGCDSIGQGQRLTFNSSGQAVGIEDGPFTSGDPILDKGLSSGAEMRKVTHPGVLSIYTDEKSGIADMLLDLTQSAGVSQE
jgi:hypothetical protein